MTQATLSHYRAIRSNLYLFPGKMNASDGEFTSLIQLSLRILGRRARTTVTTLMATFAFPLPLIDPSTSQLDCSRAVCGRWSFKMPGRSGLTEP